VAVALGHPVGVADLGDAEDLDRDAQVLGRGIGGPRAQGGDVPRREVGVCCQRPGDRRDAVVDRAPLAFEELQRGGRFEALLQAERRRVDERIGQRV
jgi:hypothetical protein